MKKTDDPRVFITTHEACCAECREELGRRAWITPGGERGVLCLSCADLDHLVFLPSGDAALTRRSRKHSTLCAVVLKWSQARKRYERQCLLVERQALETAEGECLADAEARARRRDREAGRAAERDREYVDRFAEQVRKQFPDCPPRTEELIAEHACLKYSGRVGRSAAAKALDDQAIHLAVVAHVRHTETPYDQLLATTWDRHEARQQVDEDVDVVLARWRRSDNS